MRPRILLRTHYQADEPRIIIATITDCASATESRDEDIVAASVVKWAEKVGRKISLPGAVYSVGNARALGFLNKSNRWTAAGLALGHIRNTLRLPNSQIGSELGRLEEHVFLKYYMTNAGALVIKFGTWLLQHGSTTDDQLRTESVIKKLLLEVLDDYLSIATDIRDRTAIRGERDRLGSSEYAAITKRHKWYPLRATMMRLRLLDSSDGEGTTISPDSGGRLAALLRAVPNVSVLEKLDRASSLPATLAFALKESSGMTTRSRPDPGRVVADCYRYAADLGLQACPLGFIDDILYANFAFDPDCTNRSPSAETLLEPLHRELPGEVRFHVDRRGRRAYVLLTDRVWHKLDSAATSS